MKVTQVHNPMSMVDWIIIALVKKKSLVKYLTSHSKGILEFTLNVIKNDLKRKSYEILPQISAAEGRRAGLLNTPDYFSFHLMRSNYSDRSG